LAQENAKSARRNEIFARRELRMAVLKEETGKLGKERLAGVKATR
jgi:hypothetical protein